jgi:hypothetical protein
MTVRAVSWLFAAMVVALVAFAVAVWQIGEDTASSIRESEGKAREAEARRVERAAAIQTVSVRAGCARAAARDFEAWETNRDLRTFALRAARARRADGDAAVARSYDAISERASRRMARIKVRLPVREDEASVTVFCRELYPEAHPR